LGHNKPRGAFSHIRFAINREVTMSQMLHNTSLFGRLTLIMGVVPLVMAVVYAIRPTEQNLALMRPLSLAALFAAIAGTLLGFINVLKVFWTREATSETYRVMAVGAAESLVPVLLGFACLTVAWLVVAIGMGRRSGRV
jgi:hypothetical protein